MKSHFVFLLAICLLFSACRKDISTPTDDCRKLFGTWRWVQSSGGISGQVITPDSEGYTLEIEFKSNGVVKKFKNGNKIFKKTFEFEEGESIFSTGKTYLIKYKDGMLKKMQVSNSFKFGGTDTLFLNNECQDCYSEIYLRK